jgi:ribosomal protein S3AE
VALALLTFPVKRLVQEGAGSEMSNAVHCKVEDGYVYRVQILRYTEHRFEQE